MKKNFICLLAVAVLISLFSASVTAAAVPYTVAATDEVELLKSIGILEDNFDADNLDAEATRGMAIYSFFKLMNSPVSNNGKTYFYDVLPENPYFDEINSMYVNGFISGDSDTRAFYPDSAITAAEAAACVLKIAGYTEYLENEGVYPWIHMSTAKQQGLFAGLKLSADQPLTIGDLVTILYNALTIDYVDSSAIVVTPSKDIWATKTNTNKCLFDVFFEMGVYQGVLTATGDASVKGDATGKNGIVVQVGKEYLEFESDVNLTDYIGYDIDVYSPLDGEDEDKAKYVLIHTKNSNVVSFLTDDISDIDRAVSYIKYYDAEEKEHKLKFENPTIIYNGRENFAVGADTFKKAPGMVKAVDPDNDGFYEVIFLDLYTAHIVDSVSITGEYVIDMITGQVIDLKTDSTDYDVTIYQGGKEVHINTLKQNDVLLIADSLPSGGNIKRKVYVSQSVAGDVNEISDKYLVLNDTMYPCLSNVYVKGINLGDTILAGLDLNGNIVCIYRRQDTGLQYGYITGLGVVGGLEEEIEIKLLSNKSEWVVYDLEEKFKVNGSKGTIDKLNNSPLYNAGVFVPQLISYKLNNQGKVTDINISSGTATGYVERQQENTLNMNADYPTGHFRVYRYTLGGEYTIDPQVTNIFLIVRDSHGEIIEEYSGKISYNDMRSSQTPPMKVYDADYTCIPKGLVFEIPETSLDTYMYASSAKYGYTFFFVVDKISTVIDEEGYEVTKLKGYNSSGNYVEYEVWEDVDTSFIGKGSVISFRVHDSKIRSITLRCAATVPAGFAKDDDIFKKTIFEDTTYAANQMWKAGDNAYISGQYVYLKGTVKDVVTSTGIKLFNIMCDGKDAPTTLVNGGIVIKVNKDLGNVYASNHDELDYTKPVFVYSSYGTVIAIVQYE